MAEHPTTSNHDFPLMETGTHSGIWGDVINDELINPLEAKVTIADTAASRGNYTPHDGALYFATDTGEVSIGDPDGWTVIGSITEADPIEFDIQDSGLDMGSGDTLNFGTDLDVTDAGDGRFTIDATVEGGSADNTIAVHDDGAAVTTADTVNFGSDVAVTDDGAGEVTIDAEGDDGPLVESPDIKRLFVRDTDPALEYTVTENDLWIDTSE